MRYLVDAIGYLVKTNGAGIMEPFDAVVLPFFAPLLSQANVPAALRCNALCVFDDVIEWCGPGAAKYLPAAAPAMLAYCTDADPTLRQAAIYGLGQCAANLPAAFSEHAPKVLAQMQALVQHPSARDEENTCATDNAVAVIGKILAHHSSAPGVDGAAAAELWLSQLPLREDEAEAKLAHAQLCSHVEANDPRVCGEGGRNLGRVTTIFAQVLVGGLGGGDQALDLATPRTRSRMGALLRQIQACAPADVLSSAWTALSAQQRAAVQSAVSS